MRGGPVVMLLCPVDPHGLGLLHVGRGALANPTLLVQHPGHVFVKDHIRRPTTLRSSRWVHPRMCGIERTSRRGLTGLYYQWTAMRGRYPTVVDVECPGAVF